VGLELGVRAVLVGKVVQRGDELSISAELVDARDKRQIWGEQYNRKPADILDVQDEISREILQKLRLKLSGDVQKRLAKQYTASIEAYQAYLKGRYYWNQRTEEKLEKGLWWFNQAIKHDPNYALAFVGVADSYNLLARYGPRLAKEALPQSEAAAKRALELDDSLAEAHASLGFAARWHDWDWARMEREFTRAIELNPQYAPAHHWYALMYLAAMGRQQEAIRAIKRAQELEPLTPIINTDFGRILYLGRRYDEAIEQLRKTLDLHPDFGMAHFWLGSVYEQKHMYEEAMAAFQQALRFGAFESRAALAHVHAVAGKKAEAHQALEALKDLSRQRYVPSYDIAMIYLGLGDHDRAFDWLQRAVDERYGLMAFLKVEPQFDPLRPDPRFAALVRQVRLAD